MSIREYEKNQVGNLDIYDLTTKEPWASSTSSHTDIKRLRQGQLGAQVLQKKNIVSSYFMREKALLY